jgi:hypothetical protein
VTNTSIDEPEWQRLYVNKAPNSSLSESSVGSSNTIHEALKLVFDGLYPAANIVDALLKNEDGGSERKRILDIGTHDHATIMDQSLYLFTVE